MNTTQLPDEFTVTITEEDRQKADDFCFSAECLLATAVKRHTGAYIVVEGIMGAYLDGADYLHGAFRMKDAHLTGTYKKPFYAPEVVGKQITFTRAK